MAEKPPYPRSKWIPEIPFDVAEWDDIPNPYPDGIFTDEKDRKKAEALAETMRKTAPLPE
jgi:hypothetical protein